MNNSQFTIDIVDLYWINGEKDNPEDLCLHGKVNVKIGNEVVADNYPCTVSSTALYLLKSIKENHVMGKSSNQMLPCCGHFIIASDHDDTVEICGCPSGVDWSVLHIDGGVKLVTENANEVTINLNDYIKTVSNFVNKVEEFYKKSEAKNIPADDFDRDGYIKFWKEWNNRRNSQ
ncbi:hypothetical protein JOC70_000103 [Clostridium pascui]|uniref:hypothetical protein n=1 Tax=Clostridium pascui TaxID=46609 RepID=UPI001956DDB1|nr:hypothetical protein [Clostridium pascui]MBM7868634.1 hypothetical protein [Clostridium pascui]